MHYSFLTRKQRGLRLLLKHGSFLHRLSSFTLYCHICLCISNAAHFPCTKGQCKKLKCGTFFRLNPRHVWGLGAWLKLTDINILIGRELTCSRKLMLESSHSEQSPIWSQGFGPFSENGFRAFYRAKISCIDTQHKHNKLSKIKLNSLNPILASSSCTQFS